MFHRLGAVAAVATFVIAGAANAQTLAPSESRSITLGPVSAGVYYTVAPEGDEVVATLQCSEPPCIVRFIATLAPGQAITLSTPRGVGEPPIAAQIKRQGDELIVDDVDRRVATQAPADSKAP